MKQYIHVSFIFRTELSVKINPEVFSLNIEFDKNCILQENQSYISLDLQKISSVLIYAKKFNR